MITNMKHYDPFNVKITIKKVANRKLAQPIRDDMGSACVLKIKMAGNGGFVFILSKEDHSDGRSTCGGTKSIPLEQSSNFYLLEQLFFSCINPFKNSWVNTEENKYIRFTSVEELVILFLYFSSSCWSLVIF